ncbi:PKD domain-containing protein [Fluviicola sp.]|uniref:PKD domain-containing protein n=1 Tax=Fluviicola sp. TaxID=1917219 RepID=UPI0031CDC568
MKKPILLLGALFLTLHICFSQQYNELRYREQIFSGTTSQLNVQYGAAPQWIWPYWNENLLLDVYQPVGDVITKRPLVILAHSGGFLNGAKDVSDMVALCDSLGRLGYVTATIEYRKGFNPLDNESAERAVYRGIQDGKAAVRYFKQNASLYGIDTNYIYFGGMSAGGYVALHVAYMDLESERPASTYGGGTVNDLGCLNCAGNNYAHSSKVRAILDYWGAVQDTTIIVAGDIPLMIMHGENDPTVPFDYGHPFGLATLPQTYGGWPVSIRAASVGLDYEFYTSEGNLHMLDGSDNGTFNASNPPNSFWYDTLLPRTRAFLYRMTKPNPVRISNDNVELCFGEVLNLEVDGNDASYYKWYYNTANALNVVDNHSQQLSLSFSQSGDYDVAVVEFNEVFCASDTLWFHVSYRDPVVASFSSALITVGEMSFTSSSVNGETFLWNFGDGVSSSQENPVHAYASNGTYSVQLIVTDAFGCSDTIVQQVLIESLAVTEHDLTDYVTVYPNPFSGKLVIENHLPNGITVEITDAQGKKIRMLNTQENEIILDTEKWSTGVYFVTCISDDGKNSVYKLIK